MVMAKIKKGDHVIVLAGKDKGRNGIVTKIANDRVFVEGINLIKKHQRGNPQEGVQGGIITKEASLHISNVALMDPQSKKPSRVGIKTLEDGKKVRYYKSNDEVVDV